MPSAERLESVAVDQSVLGLCYGPKQSESVLHVQCTWSSWDVHMINCQLEMVRTCASID